jgi:hypothetical protein
MRLMTATKTIGMTVKFVLEVDEEQAQRLLETLPSDITIGSESLPTVQVGVDGMQLEPVRVSLSRDDMSSEEEDDFLEND